MDFDTLSCGFTSFFCAGVKLTQRIPPLIHLLHASSSLHFILCFSFVSSSSKHTQSFMFYSQTSLILLFSAPYEPPLLPYLSKYSDHDSTHRVRGGRSDDFRS